MSGVLRLAWRLRSSRLRFAIVVAASTGVLLAGVGVATLSVAVAASIVDGDTDARLGVFLAATIVLVAVLTWVEQWVAHVLAYEVIDALRIDIHRALARLAPLGLARRSMGETITRAIGDAEALEWFYAHTAAQVVAGSAASVVLSAVAIGIAGPAGLMVPAAQVLLVLVPVVTARAARRQGAGLRAAVADLGTVALAARRFARETVLLGGIEALDAEVIAGTDRIQRARRSIAIRLGLEQAAADLVGAVVALSALGIVAMGIASGAAAAWVSPVGIVFALSATSGAILVATAIGRLGEVMGAADRVEELLTAPSTRPDSPEVTRAEPVQDAPGAAGVRIVSLVVRYPETEVAVLDGFDLAAGAGEMVAIVGSSGAGKSTVLLAVARLIPVLDGTIEIGGARIDREPAETTRRRVSLVTQHAHVFRASVRDNLLAPDADDVEVWAALDAAVLSERVQSETAGLDTVLDERGAGWSGGERQRLGLARGLIRDAGVLLLDEPTAGLDEAAERGFLDALSASRSGRTILVTTHREAVMRASDRVVVLERGRVVAEGSHADLLRRSEAYRRLLADDQEP